MKISRSFRKKVKHFFENVIGLTVGAITPLNLFCYCVALMLLFVFLLLFPLYYQFSFFSFALSISNEVRTFSDSPSKGLFILPVDLSVNIGICESET